MEKTNTTSLGPGGAPLETEEDIAAYLNVALDEGDVSLTMAVFEGHRPRQKRPLTRVDAF